MNEGTITREIEEKMLTEKLVCHWKYTMGTAPDPVVGPGYCMFPVEQYFGGRSDNSLHF